MTELKAGDHDAKPATQAIWTFLGVSRALDLFGGELFVDGVGDSPFQRS